MKREIAYPRNVLLSYYYYKEHDLDTLPHLQLIGDSGAFSAASRGATIETKDLAAWAKKWRHKLLWIASLDVIGNPQATYRNWREMVDTHGVPAVPTIHFGADPAEMDKYAARGVDFMGLGGLVGKRAQPQVQMRWLLHVFKYARTHHPTMKFHGWGCTSQHHALLPFYSVDSSSWTAGVRYGKMRLRHPRTGKLVSYNLDGKQAFAPDTARLLMNYYGASPKQASYSDVSNRDEMIRLSALACTVQEEALQKKHGTIHAPTWGINTTPYPSNGPLMYLATGGNDHHVLNAFHETEEKR